MYREHDRNVWLGLFAASIGTVAVRLPALARAKSPRCRHMGDDIGYWNIGAERQGMMAEVANLDSLLRGHAQLHDLYAEASCTAGRANFITGELPIGTSMTTGRSGYGSPYGIPAQAVTIVTALKSCGYASASLARTISVTSTSSCDRSRVRRVLRLPVSPRRDGSPCSPPPIRMLVE